MKKQLVIAGAGHAHMVTLARLSDFIRNDVSVTVVGPSAYHYYSGMGPGMLGGFYTPGDIRFAIKQWVEKNGGVFIQEKVTGLDPEGKTVTLASGRQIPYDVLSCNLGSQVRRDIIKKGARDVYTVKPIEQLADARERILALGRQRPVTVAIVGGGPSALEIAGNVHRLSRQGCAHPLTVRILTHHALMPHHPAKVRMKALASLRQRGIDVMEHCRVWEIDTGRITEPVGVVHNADVIFVATGVKPSPVFRDAGLATGPDGGLKVNKFLQHAAHPEIFGGGDCIHFTPDPLDKVGVYAVRQNPVLFHNLQAFLNNAPLKPFAPGGKYLLIFNLGDGTGIFYKWSLTFGGRLAFRIKDYIDRKFMRTFQQHAL